MKIQVKCFNADCMSDLEKELNAFLRTLKSADNLVDIKHGATAFECEGAMSDSYNFTAIVVYRA
jgi:hypothetical protein